MPFTRRLQQQNYKLPGNRLRMNIT
ncbi:hypothetical protein KSF78_0009002 [Schistosoma japonicum]|nr:hypothetical protein KSF78_0009002 [Schistosoma japonicum]KAH8858752.1 hypothetical protein KSF78_0009002 [Schistosoma japonicum]